MDGWFDMTWHAMHQNNWRAPANICDVCTTVNQSQHNQQHLGKEPLSPWSGVYVCKWCITSQETLSNIYLDIIVVRTYLPCCQQSCCCMYAWFVLCDAWCWSEFDYTVDILESGRHGRAKMPYVVIHVSLEPDFKADEWKICSFSHQDMLWDSHHFLPFVINGIQQNYVAYCTSNIVLHCYTSLRKDSLLWPNTLMV